MSFLLLAHRYEFWIRTGGAQFTVIRYVSRQISRPYLLVAQIEFQKEKKSIQCAGSRFKILKVIDIFHVNLLIDVHLTCTIFGIRHFSFDCAFSNCHYHCLSHSHSHSHSLSFDRRRQTMPTTSEIYNFEKSMLIWMIAANFQVLFTKLANVRCVFLVNTKFIWIRI